MGQYDIRHGMSGQHGGDNNEMSLAEIEQQKQEFQAAYGNSNPWKWSLAVLGALIGGVIGTGVSMYAMLSTDDSEDAAYVDANGTVILGLAFPPPPPPSISLSEAQFAYSLGLLGGLVAGLAVAMAYMGIRLIIYHQNDPFKKHVEQMREVVRKKEQLRIERHDEVIFYDAGEAHGCCFSFFCRPHYGKITSERVIYSAEHSREEDEPAESWRAKLCRICDLRLMWQRKVESVDIEHMLDVGVNQSCMQMITNVGDVTIHLVAGSDTSIVKDERDKLLVALAVDTAEKKAALHARDEETIRERIEDLKTALHTARDLQPLRALVQTAEAEVRRLVDVGMTAAREKGEEYYEPHPRPQNKAERQDNNAANKVVVKDVKRPYMVLDTMSYKIAKQVVFTNRYGQTKAQVLTHAAEASYSASCGGITAADVGMASSEAGMERAETAREKALREASEARELEAVSGLEVQAADAQKSAAGATVEAGIAQAQAETAQKEAARQIEEAKRTGGKKTATVAPEPARPAPPFAVAGQPQVAQPVGAPPGGLPPVKPPAKP